MWLLNLFIAVFFILSEMHMEMCFHALPRALAAFSHLPVLTWYGLQIKRGLAFLLSQEGMHSFSCCSGQMYGLGKHRKSCVFTSAVFQAGHGLPPEAGCVALPVPGSSEERCNFVCITSAHTFGVWVEGNTPALWREKRCPRFFPVASGKAFCCRG